jgi:hypothetical protein
MSIRSTDFVKHSIEKAFGIILLHNHFPMSPTEVLVQFGNAAVPWDTTTSSPELANIVSSSWRFVPEGLAPWVQLLKSFKEVSATIVSRSSRGIFGWVECHTLPLNLSQVLGLCALDEGDIDAPATIEITSGRANITLDVDIDPQDGDGSIEAIRQFGSSQGLD